MNQTSPFNFLTVFSKSGTPLILTDVAVSDVLSINAAAISYLHSLRIYVTSTRELVTLLQSFTKGQTPPAENALEFQPSFRNSVHQPITLTLRVQQEYLSSKPVLLFSILHSTQLTKPDPQESPPLPDTAQPVFLVGLAAEGRIEYINRSVPKIDREQVLGSSIDDWTFSDRFGDIRYYEQAIKTEQPVIYHSKMMGPNEIPISAKIYLTPVFELGSMLGFVITAVPLQDAQQN